MKKLRKILMLKAVLEALTVRRKVMMRKVMANVLAAKLNENNKIIALLRNFVFQPN